MGHSREEREDQMKGTSATTRAAALEIARRHGEAEWFDAKFQDRVVLKIAAMPPGQGAGLRLGRAGSGSWHGVFVDDFLAELQRINLVSPVLYLLTDLSNTLLPLTTRHALILSQT